MFILYRNHSIESLYFVAMGINLENNVGCLDKEVRGNLIAHICVVGEKDHFEIYLGFT